MAVATGVGRVAIAPAGSLRWDAAGEAPALLDPLSAWGLGDGRDFNPILGDTFEASGDFAFLAAWDMAHPGRVGSVLSLDSVGLQPKMDVPRLFHLPLRRTAIAASGGKAETRPARCLEHVAAFSRPEAIVVVIDHAINVLNQRFRTREHASRVVFHWAQDGVAEAGGAVPFGRERSGADLTRALARAGGDEEAALRSLDLMNASGARRMHLGMRASHGTHVADLAAGMDPEDEASERTPIIAVTLPPEVAREASGCLTPPLFLWALDYALVRAREIVAAHEGGAIPVYVSFAFGLSGGPRNGRHFLCAGAAAMIEAHKRHGTVTLCLPAGNRHLAQGHAAAETGLLDVGWRLLPGDRTSNHLEAWIGGAGPVRLALHPPGGNAVETSLDAGDMRRLRTASGFTIGSAHLSCGMEAEELRLVVSLAPTDPQGRQRDPAPSGLWGLRVEAGNGRPVEAWILRDDAIPGFADGGLQSRFEHTSARRFTVEGRLDAGPAAPPLSRAGTLNLAATHVSFVTVGGVRGRDGASAPYSAAPSADGTERVSLAAVCDASGVLSGVLGAGSRSGSRVVLNGTSVAAPQVLRAMRERRLAGADGAEALTVRNDRMYDANQPRIGRGRLAESDVNRRR